MPETDKENHQAPTSVTLMTMGKQRLDGKVAMVTHAGQDCGKEQAILLASLGASIIVTDADIAQAEQTAEDIRHAGGKAIAVAVDITVKSQIEMLVKYASGIFGGLDIVVNSAGFVYSVSELGIRDADNLEKLLTENINAALSINQTRVSGW
ncbi:SDR family NAD(P)-dependent oxidoreductase [Rouxiella badensis]|uniref:SDR family NAD(P)-dependent oxidoreductase n=1 Tax=Rouxiella badensis TaxID=1646377 RepID=UPI003C662F16